MFTVDAARDLTKLFDTDNPLQEIMTRTQIWATEEVILPTLVALLGYHIIANPCSDAYVKYRESYTLEQANAALANSNVYWIHSIERRYDECLRTHIRARVNHYEKAFGSGGPMPSEMSPAPTLLLTLPILRLMDSIEGWLAEDEADLLIAASWRALTMLPGPHPVVEIGSYCGRSTVVLGSVLKALCSETKVYAIDPHEGQVGALDQGISIGSPTLEKFQRNINEAGLGDVIETIQQYSYDVHWGQPISLLLIDGLHDYANVACDFFHFEPWIVAGGYIAFHDYADYYPGVKVFVHEILGSGQYRKVQCVGSMMVVQKQIVT